MLKKQIPISNDVLMLLMPSHRKRLFFLLLIATLPITGMTGEVAELEEIQTKYEAAQLRIKAPLTRLQISYQARLTQLKAEAQKQGDLEQVLAIDQEGKSFRTGDSKITGKYSALAAARKIYDNSAKRIHRETAASSRQLNQTYIKQLDQLRDQLTKAGRINDALAVRKFSEKVKETLSEKQPEPLKKEDLIGHWKFDRNGDDATRHRRHADLVGEAEIVKPGRIGAGALRTEIGKYAELKGDAPLDLNHPFTISMWVKPAPGATQPKYTPFIAKGTGTWTLAISGSGNYPEFIANTNLGKVVVAGEESLLAAGKWHHLAVSFDGKAVVFYFSGQPTATKELSGAVEITTSSQPVQIGGVSGRPGRNFIGLIDDVRIYKKALQEGTIQQLASGVDLKPQ